VARNAAETQEGAVAPASTGGSSEVTSG